MIKSSWLLFCLHLIGICSLTHASEIMVPASQIELGHSSVSFYYGRTDKNLSFQISSADEIKIGSSGAGYFSRVTNDIECAGQSNGINVKFTANPGDGLYYWVKLGAGHYELDIPSETVKNHLSGQDSGWRGGVGMRMRFFPDTIVTPALAVELSLDYSLYNLDKFNSGASVAQPVNDKLELTEVQSSFIVSKKVKNIEGYGGLKVFRTYVSLLDRTNFSSVSGYKDNVGVFFGAKLRVFPKEYCVLEGNLLGETGFFAGWNLEF